MLFRRVLRESAIEAIKAAKTLAGDRVESRAAQLERGDTPTVLVNIHGETTDSAAGPSGEPRFKLLCTLYLQIITSAGRFADVQDDLDLLSEQVVNALLMNPVWANQRGVEGFTELTRQPTYSADGDRYVGTEHIHLVVRYTDNYPPTLPYPLQSIVVTIDTGRPYDALGTYPKRPEFPPPPAPRTSGPDGRDELGPLTIDVPQD